MRSRRRPEVPRSRRSSTVSVERRPGVTAILVVVGQAGSVARTARRRRRGHRASRPAQAPRPCRPGFRRRSSHRGRARRRTPPARAPHRDASAEPERDEVRETARLRPLDRGVRGTRARSRLLRFGSSKASREQERRPAPPRGDVEHTRARPEPNPLAEQEKLLLGRRILDLVVPLRDDEVTRNHRADSPRCLIENSRASGGGHDQAGRRTHSSCRLVGLDGEGGWRSGAVSWPSPGSP